MNEQNYASREASQRLLDAGIVLETEKVWFFSTTGWELVDRYSKHPVNKHYLPAPSMAEAWRELPDELSLRSCSYSLRIYKYKGRSHAGYQFYEDIEIMKDSTNPTDALIDLLIWARKEAKP